MSNSELGPYIPEPKCSLKVLLEDSPSSSACVVSSGVRLLGKHPLRSKYSDLLIQDVNMVYPLVSNLIVPDCDLTARRRILSLLQKILNAASSSLALLVDFQREEREPATTPLTALMDHYRILSNHINTVNVVDTTTRFWLFHYQHQLRTKIASVCGRTALIYLNTTDPVSPPASFDNYDTKPISYLSVVELFRKLKGVHLVLKEIVDSTSGAACMVFWSKWDSIHQEMTEILNCTTPSTFRSKNGPDLCKLEQVEEGRMFQLTETAARNACRHSLLKGDDEPLPTSSRIQPVSSTSDSSVAADSPPAAVDSSLRIPPGYLIFSSSFIKEVAERNGSHPRDESIDDVNSKRAKTSHSESSDSENSKSKPKESSWPLRLTKPLGNGNSGITPLIDVTELDGIMCEEDVPKEDETEISVSPEETPIAQTTEEEQVLPKSVTQKQTQKLLDPDQDDCGDEDRHQTKEHD